LGCVVVATDCPDWAGCDVAAAGAASSCAVGEGALSSSSGMSPSALDCWLVGSEGSLSSSDRRRWCCSSRARVRRASGLVVAREALENSPAARACSLMATVELAVLVATEAARAWSWAWRSCQPGERAVERQGPACQGQRGPTLINGDDSMARRRRGAWYVASQVGAQRAAAGVVVVAGWRRGQSWARKEVRCNFRVRAQWMGKKDGMGENGGIGDGGGRDGGASGPEHTAKGAKGRQKGTNYPNPSANNHLLLVLLAWRGEALSLVSRESSSACITDGECAQCCTVHTRTRPEMGHRVVWGKPKGRAASCRSRDRWD